MKKKNIEAIYRLSPLQRGMLFEALAGADGGHLIQWDVTADIAISADLLRQTWSRLLERHTILRTEFYWEGLSEFFQVVKRPESLEVPLDTHDWADVAPSTIEERFEELMARRRREGFDPRCAPLVKLDLVRLSPTRTRFLTTVDHLVVDGWSVGMLGEELLEILRALRSGSEPFLREAHPFRDYIDWLQRQDSEAPAAFWREELRDVRPTKLPADVAEARRGARTEEALVRELEPGLSARVDALARRVGVSTNVVYQGAWALLLSRYCNEPEVTYGITTSGRLAPLEGIETRVGPFANALPMRVRIPASSRPLEDWLRDFQEKQLEIQQYEHYSLMDIMGWAGLSADRNLMEAVFSFLNVPIAQQVEAGDGLGLDVKLRRQGANPLALIVDFVHVTTLRLHYDAARFEAATARGLLDHYVNLLTSFVAEPWRPPSEHAMIAESERARLLTPWEGPTLEVEPSLDDLLEEITELQQSVAAFEEPAARPASTDSRPYVLDTLARLMPTGRTGELCFAVGTEAEGHHASPRTTAVAFLPDPYDARCGGRMVVTDELATWTHTGELVVRERERLVEVLEVVEAKARVLPRNETEETIAAIWRQHLAVAEVGVEDNFFEVGGHSMMALRMQAQLQKEFGLEFSLGEVLDRPTIAGLANFIIEKQAAGISEDDLAALLAEVRGEG